MRSLCLSVAQACWTDFADSRSWSRSSDLTTDGANYSRLRLSCQGARGSRWLYLQDIFLQELASTAGALEAVRTAFVRIVNAALPEDKVGQSRWFT